VAVGTRTILDSFGGVAKCRTVDKPQDLFKAARTIDEDRTAFPCERRGGRGQPEQSEALYDWKNIGRSDTFGEAGAGQWPLGGSVPIWRNQMTIAFDGYMLAWHIEPVDFERSVSEVSVFDRATQPMLARSRSSSGLRRSGTECHAPMPRHWGTCFGPASSPERSERRSFQFVEPALRLLRPARRPSRRFERKAVCLHRSCALL